MKITDSTALVVDNPQRYTLYSSDRKSIKQLIKTLKSINCELYLDDNDISRLNKINIENRTNNYKLLLRDIIDNKSTEITNYSLEKIKTLLIEILILFQNLHLQGLENLQIIVCPY